MYCESIPHTEYFLFLLVKDEEIIFPQNAGSGVLGIINKQSNPNTPPFPFPPLSDTYVSQPLIGYKHVCLGSNWPTTHQPSLQTQVASPHKYVTRPANHLVELPTEN